MQRPTWQIERRFWKKLSSLFCPQMMLRLWTCQPMKGQLSRQVRFEMQWRCGILFWVYIWMNYLRWSKLQRVQSGRSDRSTILKRINEEVQAGWCHGTCRNDTDAIKIAVCQETGSVGTWRWDCCYCNWIMVRSLCRCYLIWNASQRSLNTRRRFDQINKQLLVNFWRRN